MTNGDYEKIEPILRSIMGLLAAKDYEGLFAKYPKSLGAADGLREAVDEYGRTIVLPPFEAGYSRVINSFPVHGAGEIPTWKVDAPVWTAEEGRSDLTLKLEVVFGPEEPEVVVRDLRVL